MQQLNAKSREASQLRQHRSQAARRFGIPQELIGGSLNVSRRRCGKPNFRCASGEGHPQWSLALSQGGTRKAQKIPTEWVEELES